MGVLGGVGVQQMGGRRLWCAEIACHGPVCGHVRQLPAAGAQSRCQFGSGLGRLRQQHAFPGGGVLQLGEDPRCGVVLRHPVRTQPGVFLKYAGGAGAHHGQSGRIRQPTLPAAQAKGSNGVGAGEQQPVEVPALQLLDGGCEVTGILGKLLVGQRHETDVVSHLASRGLQIAGLRRVPGQH